MIAKTAVILPACVEAVEIPVQVRALEMKPSRTAEGQQAGK